MAAKHFSRHCKARRPGASSCVSPAMLECAMRKPLMHQLCLGGAGAILGVEEGETRQGEAGGGGSSGPNQAMW